MSPEQRDKLMDRLEQVRERLISIEIDIKTHAWWYLDTDHLDDESAYEKRIAMEDLIYSERDALEAEENEILKEFPEGGLGTLPGMLGRSSIYHPAGYFDSGHDQTTNRVMPTCFWRLATNDRE